MLSISSSLLSENYLHTPTKISPAISHVGIVFRTWECFNSTGKMKISYVKLIIVCESSISYEMEDSHIKSKV